MSFEENTAGLEIQHFILIGIAGKINASLAHLIRSHTAEANPQTQAHIVSPELILF